jgi:DNA segregation ATPase FtsK/SpoIIIE, S-DNA-T family
MPKKKNSQKKSKAPPPKQIPPKTTPEIRGLVLLSCTFVAFISLISFSQKEEAHNLLGIMGLTAGFLLHALFGISSYLFCLFFAWIGWRLLFNKPLNHIALKALYLIALVISTNILLSVIEREKPELSEVLSHFFYPVLKDSRLHYHLGGAPFYYLYHDLPYFNFERLFNALGTSAIFLTVWIGSVLFLAKISPWKVYAVLKGMLLPQKQPLQVPSMKFEEALPFKQDSEVMRYVKLRTPEQTSKAADEQICIQPEIEPKVRPTLSKKEARVEPISIPVETKRGDNRPVSLSDYQIPSPSLLTNAKKVDQSHLKQNLKRQAEVLEETLMSFGIEAKVGQINCGPTITSFEVHPAIGVKVQKIRTLENDIALNMEAKSIRIIAPIPGKAAVGIEVPNSVPQEVGFKEMLTAYHQGQQKFRIPILLGKAVNGDYVMSDLTKWPHCIIAGATGSGKSVCINTIVMSIVLNARPDEIKLLMIDPKKVELTPYKDLPHMLAPVITEPRDACSALNWLVKEMEKRYEILKLTGVRNIDAFNSRTINQELENSLFQEKNIEIPPKMPYYVGIIDELADLMMVSSSDIETPIARIAQMARAVGIHLILATQRPSREVITGLIKANFPTRISFKVASRVNSQIVLDEIGAESLLGNGDMLFLPPGSSILVRAQGAYIRDEDINAVLQHISKQAPPQYVIQSFRQSDFSSAGEKGDDNPSDSLYQQALETVLGTGNASTTFLQRKLKIGYARAASLIDQLEMRGVVGPAEGAKPRQILANRGSKKSEAHPDLFDGEEELP